MDENKQALELLELANNYPSPHNGQPMQLVQRQRDIFALYFETDRGLKAAPISHLFSFVTIGVFVRHLEICAAALGHSMELTLTLPKEADMAQEGRVACGSILFTFNSGTPNQELVDVIKKRQTSRKKYNAGLSAEEQLRITELTQARGITTHFVDSKQAQQVIWLNQRAVFDDMFDEPVRKELDHWMRYSKAQKHAKQDGLSYDCMELSGRSMHFAVHHHKVLRWPVVAPMLRKYYLRTMKDSSSVGYFLSPFITEEQSYNIGRCLIDVWLDLTAKGYYLHPFGTVVSNQQAHKDFTDLVGLTDESRDSKYVVFIFRAGTSKPPVESDRIPTAKHLYNQK